MKFTENMSIQDFEEANWDCYSELFIENNPEKAYLINDGDFDCMTDWLESNQDMIVEDYEQAKIDWQESEDHLRECEHYF